MRRARMESLNRRRRWRVALGVIWLSVAATQVAAQERGAPLVIMPAATLERSLLVMATDAAPSEAYAGNVRIRVGLEEGVRVYEAFHQGVTRTLHIGADSELRYVAFDPDRNRFDLLSPGLRVELEDLGLLDHAVAAVQGTGGKAYPMLGFAIVHLLPHSNPVEAADAIEALPGVMDVRLMLRGTFRVPN